MGKEKKKKKRDEAVKTRFVVCCCWCLFVDGSDLRDRKREEVANSQLKIDCSKTTSCLSLMCFFFCLLLSR